jgi:predicted dehydrogenase
MEFVTGHRITELTATTARAHDYRGADGQQVATEDGVCVLFRTDRGASGSVVVSQASPGRKNGLSFSFDGTAASYAFHQERPETLWVGGVATTSIVHRDPQLLSPAAARHAVLPAGHPQGYQDCFNGFIGDVVAAVRERRDVSGMPTFADGLRAARITSAVVESARSDSWVPVAC